MFWEHLEGIRGEQMPLPAEMGSFDRELLAKSTAITCAFKEFSAIQTIIPAKAGI